ncbi:MAG TPA: sulfotransferase [Steroidobacteraceae bacterium]|jgi:tetratricopeptide (TPR) repeat protein|nr:sulfotransferase [Steroidobacteraceae bacterium]
MNNSSPAAEPLRRALQDFSSGRVDAARATCGRILRDFPDNTAALHLSGIIAHSSGDQAEARALLRRAAEAPDTTALYVLSYAELGCKPLDRAAAVEAARRAVVIDAALPLGWLVLGTLLLEMRQLDESHACFERALRLDEHLWRARAGLSLGLARRGDTEAALACFETLLQAEPANAEARDLFAQLLQELGRYEDALNHADQAAAQRPDSLDIALRGADIELQLGRHSAALARLDVLEKTWGNEVKLLTLKAHALRLLDDYDAAAVLCRDALARGLESAELKRAYGLAQQLAGREEEALSLFEAAAALNSAVALSDKGVLLTQLGRMGEACEAFDQALVREPFLADAWYNKANARTHTPGDPSIAAMEELLGSHCPRRDQVLLHFALGKAHMETGDAEGAFAHWHAANRMKRTMIDYDAHAALRRMASMAAGPASLDARVPATGVRLSEVPVFVVGMPRSGSSLLEEILASHPQVHGGGELLQLRSLFERGFADGAGAAAGVDYSIAETVCRKLQRVSPHALRIVDKDLANFLYLGVIHRIFPRARIIHCRRDPLDTCFSAYSRLFVGNWEFTYDLGELGRYYRGYHGLMAHWREMLPSETFLEIDYETLVAEPENETRRVLDFLGLPWHEACLRFFETTRRVGTASFAQVRKPIYRSSIGRARSLSPHLRPLIEALGDLAPAA